MFNDNNVCRCRHSTGIKHFNVERIANSFFLKDVHFTTLDQLVRYYSHTDVPNKEMIHGVRLQYPIARSTPLRDVIDHEEPDSSDVYIHPVGDSLAQ